MASVARYDGFALIVRNHGRLIRVVRWLVQIDVTLLKLQFDRGSGMKKAQAAKLQSILEQRFGATVLRPDQDYAEQILIGLRDDQLTTPNLNRLAQIVQDCRQSDV